jgi:hypothetical protein
MTETESTALAVPQTSTLLRPAGTIEEIVSNQRLYHQLVEQLLDPTDFQTVEGGRSFKRKSAWRKLAVAFSVSTEVLSHEEVRDDSDRIVRSVVVARACAASGRFADGVGVCDIHERHNRRCPPDCDGVRHYSRPEHDIPATASTRATNRACADLFGAGEVSAEEMSSDHQPPGPVFDPVAMLAPHMTPNIVDSLSTWRQHQGYPSPSQFTPTQAAEALVAIGKLLAGADIISAPDPERAA